ncbi:MAG: hypoxanthine phosphoribosyltransferase [Deltaproteobacteria bacterium]|nr:hypoxanthine phosphoribosyltransferase [Deltaproteobacteria bacterium]
MNTLIYPHEIILFSEQIKEMVTELGRQITVDYVNRDLLAICVLKGSIIFFADLIRAIDLPLATDFISVSSYNGKKESSGKVEIKNDIAIPVKEKDILLVEDIIDTGISVSRIIEHLKGKGPRSIKICALLDKKGARNPSCHIRCDYSGFDVPEKFLIGYGLDYNEKYRNLPFIAAME